MTVADPVIEATERYMRAEERLRRKALEAERTRRPATAQEFRNLARICHRAAVAEEQDNKPEGLT